MKNWVSTEIDSEAAANLAASGKLPLPFAQLMIARGLHAEEHIRAFCNPKLGDLSDPFAIGGVEAAARLVLQAITENRRISIFGDYDVDGISSTCLMTRFLRETGITVNPFIPSRMEEGYGLSVDAVKRCIEEQAPDLIITVDCGVNSIEAVDYIKGAGLGVIVTDHHSPAEEHAEPDALVNPKLDDDERVRMLAGVGVAFKLCHGIVKLARNEGVEAVGAIDLRQWLDLVALGTVCDIVPLQDENRILVRQGLSIMRKTRRAGILALLRVARIKQDTLDAHHLGFQLGPRLNAAGRLADAFASLDLLSTDDEEQADELASELDSHNKERQNIEAATFEEACGIIERVPGYEKLYGIVVWKEGWHPGVIGIVASRLVRKYRRPVIAVALGDDGIGKGSGRSVDACDLVAELRACEDLLIACGGHAMAAGLEVKTEQLPAFAKAFNETVSNHLEGADLRERIDISAWIRLDQVSQQLYYAVDQLKPFGSGNKRPVWAMRGVDIKSKLPVGQKHCRVTFVQGSSQIEGIFFNHSTDEVPSGQVDVAFCIQMNTFRGRSKIELQIQDVRPAG